MEKDVSSMGMYPHIPSYRMSLSCSVLEMELAA
jgi:hypothetical protein